MTKLRVSAHLTRSELGSAATEFFQRWINALDQPRHFNLEHFDEDVVFNIEMSRDRVRELDCQLAGNIFDGQVAARASDVVLETGADFKKLPDFEKLLAQRLSARMEREFMLRHVHELSKPHTKYVPEDELFSNNSVQSISHERPTRSEAEPTLREAAANHLGRMAHRRLSQSRVDETGRVLNWLFERMGDDTPITSITKSDLRIFRNDLCRLNVSLRGQSGSFASRLTGNDERQIKSVTALRYWRTVQSFFAWCRAEGYTHDDQSEGLKLEQRKGEIRRSPPPFDQPELRRLFETPLYSGYLSAKRTSVAGLCRRREGHWWSGVLLMFTGLRGGELSQLLPEDFVFDAKIPHLRVREENEAGITVKSAKTAASIRDVPLSPVLLRLGLKEFVENRSKISKTSRIFLVFRLGPKGKKSDGLSKFWAAYLREFGIWKEGRATHVWRHTLVANLRVNGIPEQDIAGVVGHKRGTVTEGYGGAYPLHRKLHTIEKLNFGFDVVEALGGEFDPNSHL